MRSRTKAPRRKAKKISHLKREMTQKETALLGSDERFVGLWFPLCAFATLREKNNSLC
ncbi:MAG: hypothetical protein AB7E74_25850 [Pirellulales bacterium]